MPVSTDDGGRRREFLAGLGVVACVTGLVVGKQAARALSMALGGSATRPQCEALLDRWLDHASRQKDPLVDDSDVAHAEEVLRSRPEYLADLERCENELTGVEADCGIGSPNADALERCVQ